MKVILLLKKSWVQVDLLPTEPHDFFQKKKDLQKTLQELAPKVLLGHLVKAKIAPKVPSDI